MNLTSLDLYFLIKELQIIKDAKIDKVFDDKNTILFQLHLPGKGKKYLKVMLPSTIFLTSHKGRIESGRFGINIRKHIKSGRIRKIEQMYFERIVHLEIENKDGRIDIYIELFSPGNVILCKDNKIVVAKTYKGFGSRMIRPNKEYEFPIRKYNFLDLSEKELTELFEKSDKSSIVVTLATELGLGGMYSEYILKKANIDKEKTSLNSKELKRLYSLIEEIKKTEPKGYIGERITPIKIDETNEVISSFNHALDKVLTEEIIEDKKEAIISKFEKKKQKIQGIIKEQKLRIKGLKISVKQNQEKAEKIYENYVLLEKLLDDFKKITKEHTMEEIKSKLKGHKIIKKIDEKNKKIIVEL